MIIKIWTLRELSEKVGDFTPNLNEKTVLTRETDALPLKIRSQFSQLLVAQSEFDF